MLAKVRQHTRHVQHSTALHWLVGLGGVGLFLVAAVDSSLIPLPVPGSTDLFLLLLTSHKPEQWWLFAAIAVAGGTVGGYLSFRLAEKGGEHLLERFTSPRIRTLVTGWVDRHPFLSVGLPALMPPPIPLTPFVIASGVAHMPRRKFLLAFISARTTQYFLVAWLGHHYGRNIVRWYRRTLGDYTEPVLWGLVVITVVGGAVLWWRFRVKTQKLA